MIEQVNCLICNNLSKKEPTNRDGYHLICPKYGEYFISQSLESMLQYEHNRKYNYKISSWISEQNKNFDNIPHLVSTNLEIIKNQR
ncbi:hypothetical protein [Aliarcobacter butzleri]|uniref:hypothetical protein n=1 Tax=Aliarcobacter butzleri TaxID=28197 RepID=UPI003AFAB1EF